MFAFTKLDILNVLEYVFAKTFLFALKNFLPKTYLFVPKTYFFVPKTYLFVPKTYLFVPKTYLFVPKDLIYTLSCLLVKYHNNLISLYIKLIKWASQFCFADHQNAFNHRNSVCVVLVTNSVNQFIIVVSTWMARCNISNWFWISIVHLAFHIISLVIDGQFVC